MENETSEVRPQRERSGRWNLAKSIFQAEFYYGTFRRESTVMRPRWGAGRYCAPEVGRKTVLRPRWGAVQSAK